MQKILEKLQELVGICEVRIKKIEIQQAQLASDRATFAKDQEDHKEAVAAHAKFEAEMKKKKSVVATLDEANRILAEASETKKKLNEELSSLDAQKKKHAEKIADDKADIERQKDKLAKQFHELETQKKNYRKEIMDAIAKEVEGKKG